MRKSLTITAASGSLALILAGCATETVDGELIAETTTTTTTIAETTTTTEKPTTTTTEATTTTVDSLGELGNWANRTLPLVNRIGDVFKDITGGAEASDFYVIELGCAELRDIVDEAQRTTLPAPIPVLDDYWRAALTDYDEGSRLCVAGASTYDSALITSAADRFSTGADNVEKATAILTDLVG